MSFLLPSAGDAVTIVIQTWKVVDSVKVFRKQCRELVNKCIVLELQLKGDVPTLEAPGVRSAMDEAEIAIEGVRSKLNGFADYSFLRSLRQQGDIKSSLDACEKTIDLHIKRLGLKLQSETIRLQQGSAAVQERDQAELRETLQVIADRLEQGSAAVQERDRAELREALQLIVHSPQVVRQVFNDHPEIEGPEQEAEMLIHNIREQLDSDPTIDLEATASAHPLPEPRKQGHDIVQVPELDGHVEKLSSRPEPVPGGFSEIYIGRWLGQNVALKYARDLNYSANAKRLFEKEVNIWKMLRHPNVVSLYGIVHLDGQDYTVSPWMDNGDASAYLTKIRPDANRLKMLADVASGLNYLHVFNVVHGDLRAANILVDQHGHCCLADFGLSRIIEEAGPPPATSAGRSGLSTRWAAPELLLPPLIHQDQPQRSRATDVWAFGMTCLELMTDSEPYAHLKYDAQVIHQVADKHGPILPDRPGEPAISRGLSDELWLIMRNCWQSDPYARPPMSQVKFLIDGLLSNFQPPVVGKFSPSDGPMQTPLHGYLDVRQPSSGSANAVNFYDMPSATSNTSPQTWIAPKLTSSPSRAVRPLPDLPVHQTRSREPSTSSSLPGNTRDNTPGVEATSPLGSPSLPSQGPPWLNLRRLSHLSAISGHASTSPQITTLGPTPISPRSSTSSAPRYSPSQVLQGTSVPKIPDSSVGPTPVHPRPPTSAPIPIPNRTSTSRRDHASEGSPGTNSGSLSTSYGSGHPSGMSHSPATADSSYPPNIVENEENSTQYDVDPIYRLNANGVIECGNLAGLVNHLFENPSDRSFWKTFFVTYRMFTDTKTLLEVFIQRYRDAEKEMLQQQQYRVLCGLKEWFETRYIERNLQLLVRVKEFAGSIKAPDAPMLRNLAREVVVLAESRILNLQTPRPPLDDVTKNPQPPTCSYDLAIALTVLEAEAHASVLPGQIVAYLVHGSAGPSSVARSSLDDALDTHMSIARFVKHSVLRCDDLERRVQVIELMCETARDCQTKRNFSSTYAVVTALRSSQLKRLDVTYKRVSRSHRKILNELELLMADAADFKAYRDALKPGSSTCVPILSVHLEDFRHYLKEASTLEVNGHPVINFAQCSKLATAILNFRQRYKIPTVLAKDRNPEHIAYLNIKLKSTASVADDWFESRSTELRDIEQRDSRNRTTEFRRWGFM